MYIYMFDNAAKNIYKQKRMQKIIEAKKPKTKKKRPEPRIERGTSRRYAWVKSLSENHTTRPPGLLYDIPAK